MPGKGGVAQGIFYLTAGLSLKIAVGQAGSAATSKTSTWGTDGYFSGGGGGGTFGWFYLCVFSYFFLIFFFLFDPHTLSFLRLFTVWITDQPSVPLLAAGGGGGGGAYTSGYTGSSALPASIGGTTQPASSSSYGIGGSGGMVSVYSHTQTHTHTHTHIRSKRAKIDCNTDKQCPLQ